MSKKVVITSFNFPNGFDLSKKFKIVKKIGHGIEGEVYIVKEVMTGIERAAKVFLPHRNHRNKAAKFYAKKLHKLRHCPLMIQYLIQETIEHQGINVTYLVSEFVEGETLGEFIKRQKGGRLTPFQGVHLLHALAKGMEDIHRVKEYHGDLHSDNIIIQRYGLGFELKLLDMFHWGAARPENIRGDVCNLIQIFYDAIGGKKYYSSHPAEVKDICCGLKDSLILKKFRTAGQLRAYLENMEWS